MITNSKMWLAIASLGVFSGVLFHRSRRRRELEQAELNRIQHEADIETPENQEVSPQNPSMPRSESETR